MNIVIQYNRPSSFLLAISKVLFKIKHNVILWDSNKKTIYEMTQSLNPDLLFITDDFNSKNFSLLENTKYIVYGEKDDLGKSLLKISTQQNDKNSFADTISYKPGFVDHSCETDILFSSNFFDNNIELLTLMDKVFDTKKFTMKCCGNAVLPSIYFIGQTDTEQFSNIAAASKIVICNDIIEKKSLLYYKTYALLTSEVKDLNNLFTLVNEDKLRKKQIKTLGKDIVPSFKIVSNILKKIHLEEEINKIQQILGEIL